MHQVFTPDGDFDRENCPYESYREMEFAPALPAARMAYFHRHFLGVPRPPPSEDVGLTVNFTITPKLIVLIGLEDISHARSRFHRASSGPCLNCRA